MIQSKYIPGARWRSGREFDTTLGAKGFSTLDTVEIRIAEMNGGNQEDAVLVLSSHAAMRLMLEVMHELTWMRYEGNAATLKKIAAVVSELAPHVLSFPTGGNDAT